MKRRTMIPLACLLAGLCSLPAAAQEPAAAPIRVGTVVPARVFVGLDETALQQQRLNRRRQELELSQQQRGQALDELRMERDQVRPGTDQWRQRNQELMLKVDEFEVWARGQQREAQQMQKQQMADLFAKIQQAIAEVARERGIHLVVAEPDIPPIELLTPEDLRSLLNQRNLLFAADQVDITEDVINRMNEQFRDGR